MLLESFSISNFKLLSAAFILVGLFFCLSYITSVSASGYSGISEGISVHMYTGTYEVSRNNEGEYKKVVYADTGGSKVVKSNDGVELSNWDKEFVYTDQVGSTSFNLDNNGEITEEFKNGNDINKLRYFAYGSTINSIDISNLPTTDTYTGQKEDSELDLMYYNARYYDPVRGRFIQADSVNDGLNRYMYVSGNPINANDPSGNVCEKTFLIFSSCTKKYFQEQYDVTVNGIGDFTTDQLISMDTLFSTYSEDILGGLTIERANLGGMALASYEENIIKINKYALPTYNALTDEYSSIQGLNADVAMDIFKGTLGEEGDDLIKMTFEFVLAHEIEHHYQTLVQDNSRVSQFRDLLISDEKKSIWVDDINNKDPAEYNSLLAYLNKNDLSTDIDIIYPRYFLGDKNGFVGDALTRYSKTDVYEAMGEYAALYRVSILTGQEPNRHYNNMNYPLGLNDLFRY